MTKRNFFLISYDITDNNRRCRLHRFLRQFGNRVQYSVFEFYLTEKEFLYVQNEIKRIIDKKKDKIRLWQFCEICIKETFCMGKYEILKEEPKYYMC